MKEKIKDMLCTEMFEFSKIKSEKQKELDEIYKKYSDKFKSELNKEQMEIFNKCCDSYLDVVGNEGEELFYNGFALGIKFILQILN